MTRRGIRALLARFSCALLAASATSACFAPDFGECLACDGPGACPSGQVCVGNVCLEPGSDPSVCRAGGGGGGGSAQMPASTLVAGGGSGGGASLARCR